MKVTNVVKNLKISSRKLNLLASSVRGCDIDDAVRKLTFCKKRSAQYVIKAINTCVANLTNNHGVAYTSDYYIREMYVGKTMTLKRSMPRARGRIYRIHKYFSRLTVVIDNEKVESKRSKLKDTLKIQYAKRKDAANNIDVSNNIDAVTNIDTNVEKNDTKVLKEAIINVQDNKSNEKIDNDKV